MSEYSQWKRNSGLPPNVRVDTACVNTRMKHLLKLKKSLTPFIVREKLQGLGHFETPFSKAYHHVCKEINRRRRRHKQNSL